MFLIVFETSNNIFNQNHQITECIQLKFEFQRFGAKKVVVDFTGGILSWGEVSYC